MIILSIAPVTFLGEDIPARATLDWCFSKFVDSCAIPDPVFSRWHLCFHFWKCLWISCIFGTLTFTRIFHSSYSAIREPFSDCHSQFGGCFIIVYIIPVLPFSLLFLWDSKLKNGFSISFTFSLRLYFSLSFCWHFKYFYPLFSYQFINFFAILFFNSLLFSAFSFVFTFCSWM